MTNQETLIAQCIWFIALISTLDDTEIQNLHSKARR